MMNQCQYFVLLRVLNPTMVDNVAKRALAGPVVYRFMPGVALTDSG